MDNSATKSQNATKETKGNTKLFQKFSEAFLRIKLSIEQGFYFETITIVESIITNRIKSNLTGRNLITDEYLTFFDIIEKVKDSTPEKLNLIDELHEWRKNRNKAIHNIINHKEENIVFFMETVKKTAIKGEELARTVDKWYEQEKKEFQKSQ